MEPLSGTLAWDVAQDAPMAPRERRIAWFHPPKSGSSFATAIFRLANSSLPSDAQADHGGYCNKSACDPTLPLRAPCVRCDFRIAHAVMRFAYRFPFQQWFRGVFPLERSAQWGGHFWPGDHNGVAESVYAAYRGSYVAMFRDPAWRAASGYVRACKRPIKDKRAVLRYAERIQGWVVRSLAGQLSAVVEGVPQSVYETCEADCSNTRPCAPTAPWALQKARTRLAEGFKFVGMTDQWTLSICLLHAKFGGRCRASELLNVRPTKLVCQNSSSRSAAEASCATSTAEAAAELRRAGFHDPFDDVLFHDAQNRFWADLRLYNVTPSRCAKLGCTPLSTVELETMALQPTSAPPSQVLMAFTWGFGPLTVQPAAEPLALNHEVSESVLEVARLVPRQSIEQSRLWVTPTVQVPISVTKAVNVSTLPSSLTGYAAKAHALLHTGDGSVTHVIWLDGDVHLCRGASSVNFLLQTLAAAPTGDVFWQLARAACPGYSNGTCGLPVSHQLRSHLEQSPTSEMDAFAEFRERNTGLFAVRRGSAATGRFLQTALDMYPLMIATGNVTGNGGFANQPSFREAFFLHRQELSEVLFDTSFACRPNRLAGLGCSPGSLCSICACNEDAPPSLRSCSIVHLHGQRKVCTARAQAAATAASTRMRRTATTSEGTVAHDKVPMGSAGHDEVPS